MKILLKEQALQRNNSDLCVVTEFPMGDEMLNFAIVRVSGKYPTSGHAVNRVCREMVYIHEGTGRVVVDGQEHRLKSGDLVLIEAGEKFSWDGNMQLHISCNPAFIVEQHQHVD